MEILAVEKRERGYVYKIGEENGGVYSNGDWFPEDDLSECK